MIAEFLFRLDNFEILNFQTCQLWKLKNSILQILNANIYSYFETKFRSYI